MLSNGIACKPAILAKHISIRHMLKLHIRFMINSFVLSVCLYCCLWVCLHSCACYRKQQGVSVWAPEEGGPWPVLQDTEGKAHLALIPKALLVCAHIQTHIQTKTPQHHIHTYAHTTSRQIPPGSPLLTDASCLPVQTTLLHVQCVPTGWPRGQVKGQTHPLVHLWCFCYCWILFKSVDPLTSAQTELTAISVPHKTGN